MRRFVLWDFPRASWQYDLMVGLILAFIFLTPRAWFRDQPRVPTASRMAALPVERGAHVFWIEAELLSGVAEDQRPRKAAELLRSQAGEKWTVLSVSPVLDSDQEVKGYIAVTGPARPASR